MTPVDTRAAIDRFLTSPGLSDATRRAYRFDLDPFADWLDARGAASSTTSSSRSTPT